MHARSIRKGMLETSRLEQRISALTASSFGFESRGLSYALTSRFFFPACQKKTMPESQGHDLIVRKRAPADREITATGHKKKV